MKTLFFLMLGLAVTAPAVADSPKVDFAHEVLPILEARCAKCHTNGTYKGSLSLDTRETLLKSEIVVPGKSAESELVARVTSDDESLRMPPEEEGKPLTEKEVATLRRWIDAGLPWQEGFTFKAKTDTRPLTVTKPEMPSAAGGVTHPLDRLVLDYWTQHDVAPPPLTDDAAFLRRVSLDLVGLLPTPEELDAFLADQSPDKRARKIQELLGREVAYAEHWLSFWNDLLRNDYVGTGYIDGGRKPITAWLYPALRENKPYDQFVRELIDPSPQSEGFIKGIKWRGRVNASQVREIQFAQNVSQVFLGINLKCASCHDSFINDWKLKDAYGLAAVVSDRPLEIHRCDVPTGETASAKFLFPELGEIDPSQPRAERLAKLAELMTDRSNGRLARTIVNRLWQRLLGRGIVHPVDIMANQAWSEDVLDYLAWDFAEHGYDLKRTLELITTSRAYQSQAVARDEEPGGDGAEYVFRGPRLKRMTAEQLVDAVWRITGAAPKKPAADFGERGGEPVRAALVVSGPLMRSLGRPNREQVVTTRPAELTTLQALDLSNGPVLADLVARGARHQRTLHPDWSAGQFAEHLYRTALSRSPTESERQIAIELIGSPPTNPGLSDFLWTLFMLPEFQAIR